MSSKYILILCCFLFLIFFSCDKENFDNKTSTTENFTPDVSLLPYGTWVINFDDTTTIQIDSAWLAKDGFDASMYGTNFGGPGYSIDFLANTNGLLLEIGVYDLQKFELGSTSSTTIWEGDQINGTVEITNAEEVYDPVYNAIRNELSGFINATLTSNGFDHDISSSFNKIKQ
ncbi:MAG: hypothetical protein AB8F94_10325 [Saprospiraceae bacterium]